MKTAEKDKPGSISEQLRVKAGKKQRRQLIVLGSLTAVLGLVISSQFSSDETPIVAQPKSGVAQAMTEDATESSGVDLVPVVIEANPVLSRPLAEFGADDDSEGGTEDGAELESDPFSAFWSTPTEVQEIDVKLQPPSINLSATLASQRLPVAVIDGRMHFVGDSIQGWNLEEIRERTIVLRSPSQDIHTVEMPVLYGRIDSPPVVGDILPDGVHDTDTMIPDALQADALFADPFTLSSGPTAEVDSH